MIFPEHKIAFIDISKCGGYAIRSSIFETIGLKIENLTKAQKQYYGETLIEDSPFHAHASLREIERTFDLTGWRIFSVIRDPLERAISELFYQQRPDVGLPPIDPDISIQKGTLWDRAFHNHALSQTEMLDSDMGHVPEVFMFSDIEAAFDVIHTAIFGVGKALVRKNNTPRDFKWSDLDCKSVHAILDRWGEDYKTFPQLGKTLQGGRAVNVVMAMDKGASLPTAATINSVAKNLAQGYRAHFRVFCRQIKLPDRIYGSNFTVEFLKPSVYLESNLPAHVSQSANDRLLSLNFLDWDKCILLDYDQLALADISEMFDLHVDGYARGRKVELSAYEAAFKWFHTSISDKRKEEAKKFQLLSFGAIINIKKCREDALLPKIQNVLAEEAVGEQLAFCLAANGDYSDLDSKWNTLQTLGDEVTEDSRIIHFSMPTKPWWNRNMAHAKKWISYETTWEDLRSESGVYTAT